MNPDTLDRLDRMFAEAKRIIDGLPGVTIGYIGNMENWGDDREWFIFLPHPGRAGKATDRLGGFDTDNRYRLLPIARTLRLGYELKEDN